MFGNHGNDPNFNSNMEQSKHGPSNVSPMNFSFSLPTQPSAASYRTSSSSAFGQNNANPAPMSISAIGGAPPSSSSSVVTATSAANLFGMQQPASNMSSPMSGNNVFGATPPPSRNVFGATSMSNVTPSAAPGSMFRASSAPNVASTSPANVFGAPITPLAGNAFGTPSASNVTSTMSRNMFGAPVALNVASPPMETAGFGTPPAANAAFAKPGNIFAVTSTASGNIFGAPPPAVVASTNAPTFQFNPPKVADGTLPINNAFTSATAPQLFGNSSRNASAALTQNAVTQQSFSSQHSVSVFGAATSPAFATGQSLFKQSVNSSTNMFASKPSSTSSTTNVFSNVNASAQAAGNVFGKISSQETFSGPSIFSSTTSSNAFVPSIAANIFGDAKSENRPLFAPRTTSAKNENRPLFAPRAVSAAEDGNVFRPSAVKSDASGYQFAAAPLSAAAASFSFASSTPKTSSNIFSSASSSAGSPSSAQESIFKMPAAVATPLVAAAEEESHDRKATSRKGSKRAVEDDESEETPAKSRDARQTSSTRRLTIQRPVLAGGLFGHALSDLHKSKAEPKPKPSSSSKGRERTPTTSPSIADDAQHHRGGGASKEEPERRAKRHDVRTVSTEEILKIKSIVFKGLPQAYNNNETIRSLFSQYGEITRIYCSPAKYSCIIHFVSHEEAALAKQRGLELFPASESMGIFWSISSTRKTQKETESPKPTAAAAEKTAKQKSPNSSYASDIDDELRSMSSGTSDMEVQTFLQRPSDASKGSKKSSKRASKRGAKAKKRRDSEDALQSVQSVMEKPAVTAAEKYLVLQARDKLLREARKKQSYSASTKNAVGSCPDMCPEKERYMREDRRQLHSYEIAYQATKAGEEPKVDHKAAVKEYSRSSADQEEPLPHELRPPDVLKMTLDYLICNIIDHPDHSDNPADWYDFIWNRTRSIRKDITQQHLCDFTCVDLVEKCARFHIHCAERMCEDSLSNFDPKINNENLTKCLQTLKHFYHDLGLKNCVCPNEPEFRAYDVLLHLNDANVLWEVQQLRVDVQRSPQVRFALQTFASVNSNNYVRFFKLVREASYLNACIMHRYFVQVRSKALKTITRACCAPTQKTPHPVKELTRILGFEDDKSAGEICVGHGLVVVRNHIILDRNQISNPEGTLPLTRSKNLIELKCTTLVGEVVNNGPLPPNPLSFHQPECSFDSQGHFVERDVDAPSAKAEDRPVASDANPFVPERTLESQEHSKTLLQVDEVHKHAKDVSATIINEEVQSSVADIGSNYLANLVLLKQVEREMSVSLLVDVTDSFLRRIADEAMAEEEELERQRQRNMEQERQMAEAITLRMKQMEARVVDSVIESLMNDVLIMEVYNVREEIRKEEAQLAQQFMGDCSSEILEDLITDIARNEMKEVITGVYHEDVIERKLKLASIANNLRRLQIHSFFQLWRTNAVRKRRNRLNALEFPSIPGTQRLSKSTRNAGNKSMAVHLPTERVRQQSYMRRLFDVTLSYRILSEQIHATPINVLEAAHPILRREKISSNVYWKLAISLPSRVIPSPVVGTERPKQFGNWLHRKIAHNNLKETNDKVQLWSQYSIDISSSRLVSERSFVFCVRAVAGTLTNHEAIYYKNNHNFLGTHGILYVLEPPLSEQSWPVAYERLQQILQLNRFEPPLPVVVLLCGWTNDEFNGMNGISRLRLDRSKHERMLSEYFTCGVPQLGSVRSHMELTLALTTLAEYKPTLPNLNCLTVDSFVEDVMTRHFFVPAYQDLANRKRRGCVHQLPDKLIALYNACLEHARDAARSPTLKTISWPVSELAGSPQHPNLPPLNWNTEQYLAPITDLLLKLELPAFALTTPDSWSSVTQQIIDYTIAVGASQTAKEFLLMKINPLLDKVRNRFRRQCRAAFSVDDVEPLASDVPWMDVVHVWVDYKLSTLGSRESNKDDNLYYLEEEVDDFKYLFEWRTTLREDGTEEMTVHKAMEHAFAIHLCKKITREEPDLEKCATKSKSPDGTVKIDFNIEGLLSNITKEKESTREYEETLRFHLDDFALLNSEAKTPVPRGCGRSRRRAKRLEREEATFRVRSTTPVREISSATKDPVYDRSFSDQIADLALGIKEQRALDAAFGKRFKYLECIAAADLHKY